jgi:hypothetical protein
VLKLKRFVLKLKPDVLKLKPVVLKLKPVVLKLKPVVLKPACARAGQPLAIALSAGAACAIKVNE